MRRIGILLIILISGCISIPEIPVPNISSIINTSNISQSQSPDLLSPSGNTIFLVADSIPGFDYAGISSIRITLKDLELFNGSWTNISDSKTTYDLVKLENGGRPHLYAQNNIHPGLYTKLKLRISDVVVTRNGVDYSAILPSREFVIGTPITIKEKKNMEILLDFILYDTTVEGTKLVKAIHVSEGGVVFTPIVDLTILENAGVVILPNKSAIIQNATSTPKQRFGMNHIGEVGLDKRVIGNLNVVNGNILSS